MLKAVSVRVRSIQIMQVRVQNKGQSVWKSRYDGDVSGMSLKYQFQLFEHLICSMAFETLLET